MKLLTELKQISLKMITVFAGKNKAEAQQLHKNCKNFVQKYRTNDHCMTSEEKEFKISDAELICETIEKGAASLP